MGHHQKKNSELQALISSYSNDSSGNHIDSCTGDNEPNNSSKFKRIVDRFKLISSSSSTSKTNTLFHHNHNRKRSTINLRSRDYKTDASGKKGFKVKIPLKLLLYVAVVFFLVPLMIAFIILVRIFFHQGDRYRTKGNGNIQTKNVGMEENGAKDATKNQLHSSLNTLEGRIRGGGSHAVISSPVGSSNGIYDSGVGITGMATDLIGSGVENVADITAQHESEKATKLFNDATPVLEQQKGVEESVEDNVDATSTVDEHLLRADDNLVGINTNSVSSSIEYNPKAEPVENEEKPVTSVADSLKQ